MKNFTKLLGACLVIILLWLFTPMQEHVMRLWYDFTTGQHIIESHDEIDLIFQNLQKIPYAQLPLSYRESTGMVNSFYENKLKKRYFYVLEGSDIFHFLVGDFRIIDFLPNDEFLGEHLTKLLTKHKVYWLVDEKVIHKTLDFQNALYKKGYNETGFKIVNGFRHPKYNSEIGGVPKSHHQLGEAIDIVIGDVDDNGAANQEDKSIILDILENEIIKDEGGVGRYLGTMSVHYDTRGYRARWNQQGGGNVK